MDDISRELTSEECWEFLRSSEFGRFAFHLVDEVHIVPVNYAVDDETLLIRTAAGSKLLGITMNHDCAFEIDEYDDEVARSVVVRGRARVLGEDEEHRVEQVSLHPWAGTIKYNVIEVAPTEISGRRFALHRVPTEMGCGVRSEGGDREEILGAVKSQRLSWVGELGAKRSVG